MNDDRKDIQTGIRVLLSFLGTWGIVAIASQIIEVPTLYVGFFSLIFSTLFVVLFNVSFSSKKTILIILLCGINIYLLVFRNMTKAGLLGMYSTFRVFSEYYSGIILPELGGNSHSSSNQIYAVIVICIIVAFVVSVEVSYLKKMIGAVICIVPVFGLFLFFAIIPGVFGIILCMAFVLGTATINNKNFNPISTVIVISVCMISAFLSIIFIPRFNYQKPQIFIDMYWLIDDYFGSGARRNRAMRGGLNIINDGKLGENDAIEYRYYPVAHLTTISTGTNQYIRKFIGLDYYNNSWIRVGDNHQYDEYTANVFRGIDIYKQRRLELGFSEDDYYYDRVMTYDYIFSENDTTVSKKAYYLDIPFMDYEKLSKFPKPTNYAEVEKNAYTNFVDVPNELKPMLTEITGDVELDTYKEKLAYIQYVKNYLRDNCRYTLRPGKVPEGKDFVTYFLNESKEGYCTYFATAATLMFRNAGIPARYCEGYVVRNSEVLQGEVFSKSYERFFTNSKMVNINIDTYDLDILDSSAHAWVEVFLENYGWLTIEVTPGYSGMDSYTDEYTVDDDDEVDESDSGTATGQNNTQDTEEETETAEDNNEKLKGLRIYIDFRIILGIILIVVVGMGLFITIQRISRKRNMFRYDKDIQDKIKQMFVYMEKVLAAGGLRRNSNMDYEDYVYFLTCRNSFFEDINIGECVNIVLKVRFSKDYEPTHEEFVLIRDTVKKVRRFVLANQKIYLKFVTVVIKGL